MTAVLDTPPDTKSEIAVAPALRGGSATGLFRVIEVWTVADGTLSLDSSIYRDAPATEAEGRTLHFDAGGGLPGRVLADGVPVVFSDLQTEAFARSAAAKADGLSAGVGVPVYDDGAITAVVLLLFSSEESAVGAIESWLPDKDRNELRLGTSYYAGLPRFEMISRYVQFPFGSGLPGEVKQSALPRLLTGLGRSAAFIRAAGADAEGLSVALAWPVIEYGDDLRSVLILLSSSAAPLARVMQVWEEDGETLRPTRNVSERCRPLAEAAAAVEVRSGTGLLGRVWATRRPLATTDLTEESPEVQRAAAEAGVTGAIAIPVFRGTDLRGVVALWG